jgi:excisionase family DNA binding protein
VSDGRLLLSLDQAAAALSLSRRTVQTLIYSAELPSVKVGRSRRVAVADLHAYVDRLRHEVGGRLEVVR